MASIILPQLFAILTLTAMLAAAQQQQYFGGGGNSNTRCYTCVSDVRGYDYNHCRILDGNQWNSPSTYYCPSGRCVKMDVVVRDEVYPRTYRFCDYDGLVTNIGGDQYSSQSGFDRIGQQIIQPNQCSNVEARTIINSLMNVANRVRGSQPASTAGQSSTTNDQRYNNNPNDYNRNNNIDNTRQRDFAYDNRNYNNNNNYNPNNNRPYVSGSASTYDSRSGTYNTQSYDSRYDNNNNVNRFNTNNNIPNTFDNRNSFSSGGVVVGTSSAAFDPSRNNYDNRYGSSSSSSSNSPGIYVNNDPYVRRNKRQSAVASGNYVDGRSAAVGSAVVQPAFTFDDLRLENVNGLRVCRCDYDLCNGAVNSVVNFVVLLSSLTVVLSCFFSAGRWV